MNRFKEPSTYAGLGVMFAAVSQIIASGGKDATAWASGIGALMAVLLREKSAA